MSLALTRCASFQLMPCKKQIADILGCRWVLRLWPTCCGLDFSNTNQPTLTGSTVTVLSFLPGTDRCCYTACFTLLVMRCRLSKSSSSVNGAALLRDILSADLLRVSRLRPAL